MRKPKEQLKKNKLIIAAVFLIAILLIVVIVWLLCNPKGSETETETETYQLVNNAIKNTESMQDFMIQLGTTAKIMIGDVTQETSTAGYIVSLDNMNDVYVYVNTSSYTPNNTEADFNVTVSMFSDGEKVYDNSSGKNVEIDMTCEELEDIVKSYELYKYNEKDAKNTSFLENEMSGYENSGEMTITLSAVNDEVLEAYAAKLSEITGEDVKKSDLNLTAAFVTHSIYEEKVQAQTYTFEVEYITESGETVDYSVTSKVSYMDSFEDEDIDYSIPIEIEEE